MQLSTQNKMILFVVAVLLVGVGFVVAAIVPQVNRLGNLDGSLTKAQADIDSANALLARREAAKGVAAQTEASMLRLDNQMPDAPELPALIIDVQQAANDAGVELDSLSPAKPAEAGSYQRIVMQFIARGEWADVLDFMRRLQDMERSIRILSVSTKPAASQSTTSTASDTGPQKIEASLKIEAYTAPLASKAATAAPGAPGATPAKSQ
jgi:Tfp pilus assembly protein PilO